MFNYKMAEITKILERTDLDELAPKDALDILYRCKRKKGSKKKGEDYEKKWKGI